MKRAREWTDEQIKNYFLGIKSSDYPSVIWERMEPDLRGCTTLTDIGCGPGAFTLKALEKGFAVRAVDVSSKNLAALQRQAGNTPALKIIRGCWPAVEVEKSDAVVCAYSFGGRIGTAEGIKKAIENTKRVAFFIVPSGRKQADFLSRDLYTRLGIEPPAFNGASHDLLRIFAELDLEVRDEQISYDFGMPLEDKTEIEHCAVYLADKLGLPSPALLREHLQEIVTMRHGLLWVPNPRQSSIITWKRRT